jgi:pilus assembly protein Flp/PilA
MTTTQLGTLLQIKTPNARLLTSHSDDSSASWAKGGVQMFHGLSRWVVSQMHSLSNERGATAVEYGLMVALIAAVIVAVVALLGEQIQAAFQTVVDALP